MFTVFSGLAALINYEIYSTLYTSAAPLDFIGFNTIAPVLPFVALAVLSFSVAIITSKSLKSEAEKEMQNKQEAGKEEPN